LFAYDIDIRTGDSHSIIDTITNERVNHARDVIIGNHVWVAAHVSILKGSYISDNSVIATRALVTKRFEVPNILIGGIPARKIKSNINWDRKRIYANGVQNDLVDQPII
jgi:acetyltransferase-like isoleucine patch superfamily enzyme